MKEKIKSRLELLDRGPQVNKGKLMRNVFDIWTVMPKFSPGRYCIKSGIFYFGHSKEMLNKYKKEKDRF